MNCKPGDLAVVVRSRTLENVGKIVAVLEAYRDQSNLLLLDGGAAWMCEAAGSPLKWTTLWGAGTDVRQVGPIPDECLKPLRGDVDDDAENTRVEKLGLADNKMLA